MTYGWEDYIDKMVRDLVNATVLFADVVPVEVSNNRMHLISTQVSRERYTVYRKYYASL